jgi:hypothetical protein
MSLVFCGCETWFLTPREKHKFREFGNKMLRRMCEAKRDKVIEIEKVT